MELAKALAMTERHPGTITIVSLAHGLSRVISAFDLPMDARFARTESGTEVPIATILELRDGRVAAFDPNRKLIRVVERKS